MACFWIALLSCPFTNDDERGPEQGMGIIGFTWCGTSGKHLNIKGSRNKQGEGAGNWFALDRRHLLDDIRAL